MLWGRGGHRHVTETPRLLTGFSGWGLGREGNGSWGCSEQQA